MADETGFQLGDDQEAAGEEAKVELQGSHESGIPFAGKFLEAKKTAEADQDRLTTASVTSNVQTPTVATQSSAGLNVVRW